MGLQGGGDIWAKTEEMGSCSGSYPWENVPGTGSLCEVPDVGTCVFVTQQGGQCGQSGTSKGQSSRRGSQRNNIRESEGGGRERVAGSVWCGNEATRPAQRCKLLKGLLHLVKLELRRALIWCDLHFQRTLLAAMWKRGCRHKGGGRETSYKAGTQVKDDSVKFSSRWPPTVRSGQILCIFWMQSPQSRVLLLLILYHSKLPVYYLRIF